MLKGKVVFEFMSSGSKSDGFHPFLILEDGKKVKLALRGDNPFMHTKLKAYNEKNVVVEGEFNDNGKFIATEISEDAPLKVEGAKEVAPEAKQDVPSVGFHAKTFPCKKLCAQEEVSAETCEEATAETQTEVTEPECECACETEKETECECEESSPEVSEEETTSEEETINEEENFEE